MSEVVKVLPELSLAVAAAAYLLLGYPLRRFRWWRALLATAGLVLAAVFVLHGFFTEGLAFGVLRLDPFARAMDLVFLLASAFALFVGLDQRELPYETEFFVLTAALGMMLLGKAVNLVVAILALETLSFSLYALVGMARDRAGTEAALKYFFLGAIATGFMVLGAGLLYANSGTFLFPQLLKGPWNPLTLTGALAFLVGVLFKLSGVPFHFWTPDVFRGAPPGTASLIATGSKAAALAFALRLFWGALPPEAWQALLWWVAVFTMFVGNTAALLERNVKRMLGFSAIAHAGYALVGVIYSGWDAVLFYMALYTLMTGAAFGALVLFEPNTSLDNFRGLVRRRPGLAFTLALLMFSLAGIPPLAGFAAKFFLFAGALKAGHLSLVIIGLINGVISAYYYLRVVVYSFMLEPEGEVEIAQPRYSSVALGVGAALTVLLGLFPGALMNALKLVF